VSPPPDPAARVRRPWPYTAAAVALLCILGFAAVTIAIFGHGPLLGIDRAVSRELAAGRPHWLIRGFEAETSTAAFYPAASFLVVVSALVALVERAWRPLLLGAAAVSLAGVSVATGKQVIGRSRLPFSADTFGEGGTSYPSGHTTMAVVMGGVLLLLFAHRMSVPFRRVCFALVVAYAGLTGFSRVYLHDHWFTDVLAGWLLGTAIVCVLAIAFESRWRGRRQPRTLA
jgi:membrane-associated phospholipid phosphatase